MTEPLTHRRAARSIRTAFIGCLTLSLMTTYPVVFAQSTGDSASIRVPLNEFMPAQPGQTLAEIASYIMPDKSVTLEQMTWALFIKNPLQFTEDNINSLVHRPHLAIPSLEEIQATRHEQAVANIARHHTRWADKDAPTGTALLTQRPQDDERPQEQYSILLFNRPLTIGGEVDAGFRQRKDFSLGRQDDDDLRVSLGVQFELLYRLSRNTSLYLEIEPEHRNELHSEDGETERSTEIELGELWLHISIPGNEHLSLQIGRQYFGDAREWWWDEDLDAVRVLYAADKMKAQLGIGANPRAISTENDDIDPEDESIVWLLTSASWQWAKKNYLEAFFLSHFDHSPTPDEGDIVAEDREDDEDAALSWLGLRSRGRLKIGDAGRLHHWLDTGVVYGRSTLIDFDDIGNDRSEVDQRLDQTVNGWGLDVGIIWDSKLAYEPYFTVSYAMGSGDPDTDDGIDRSYRQSGLQSNDDKFRGATSFRYYGELLRPELSNLRITTLALGVPLFEDSSVDLVYHSYRQIHAANRLRDDRLRTNPRGEDRDIGEEYNIILGLEEWEHVEVEAVAALFRAGKAYGDFSGQTATSVVVQAEYNF